MKGLPSHHVRVLESSELQKAEQINLLSKAESKKGQEAEVLERFTELSLIWSLVESPQQQRTDEEGVRPLRKKIRALFSLMPIAQAEKQRITADSVFYKFYPELKSLLSKIEAASSDDKNPSDRLEYHHYDPKRDVLEVVADAATIVLLASDSQVISVMRWD